MHARVCLVEVAYSARVEHPFGFGYTVKSVPRFGGYCPPSMGNQQMYQNTSVAARSQRPNASNPLDFCCDIDIQALPLGLRLHINFDGAA